MSIAREALNNSRLFFRGGISPYSHSKSSQYACYSHDFEYKYEKILRPKNSAGVIQSFPRAL